MCLWQGLHCSENEWELLYLCQDIVEFQQVLLNWQVEWVLWKWRRDARKHVINTSLSVKVYSVFHSLMPCLQISLSSWMKVLYFLNTSCNIPILKPNTSASVFTFLITLSWLLKKTDCFFIINSLQAFGSDAFLMIQWKYYCWFRVYLYFTVLLEAQQGLLSYTSLCFQLHQDNYAKPIIVSCFFNNFYQYNAFTVPFP